jgi:hypothetical protein
MQFQQIPPSMRSPQARSSPDTGASVNNGPSVKEIPFDHVAIFNLQGRRGNRVQDVINISTEGAFVAVSIGYSFIPALPIIKNRDAANITPLNPIIDPFIDEGGEGGTVSSDEEERQRQLLLQSLFQCFQVRLCGIDFKYSVVDSGSGRELQNQPIHNLAGLGKADGDRPFRPLAKPMVFVPRSTIRIEVEEISEGPIYPGAQLFIVLHGYKMLGYGTGLP